MKFASNPVLNKALTERIEAAKAAPGAQTAAPIAPPARAQAQQLMRRGPRGASLMRFGAASPVAAKRLIG